MYVVLELSSSDIEPKMAHAIILWGKFGAVRKCTIKNKGVWVR